MPPKTPIKKMSTANVQKISRQPTSFPSKPKTAGKQKSNKGDFEEFTDEEAERELAAWQAAVAEEIRKKQLEEEELIVKERIEVGRYASGDVSHIIRRTMRDLYDASLPIEVASGPSSGTSDYMSPRGNMALYQPLAPAIPVEARISQLQERTSRKLRMYKQHEELVLHAFHEAEEKDASRTAKLFDDYGVIPELDAVGPERQTVDLAGGQLEQNQLVDLQHVVDDAAGRQTRQLLPVLARPPEGSDRKRSHKAEERERLRHHKERINASLGKRSNQLTGMLTAEELEKRKKRDAEARKRMRLLRTMMPAEQIDENKRILRKMRDRQQFLVNPRFANSPTKNANTASGRGVGPLEAIPSHLLNISLYQQGQLNPQSFTSISSKGSVLESQTGEQQQHDEYYDGDDHEQSPRDDDEQQPLSENDDEHHGDYDDEDLSYPSELLGSYLPAQLQLSPPLLLYKEPNTLSLRVSRTSEVFLHNPTDSPVEFVWTAPQALPTTPRVWGQRPVSAPARHDEPLHMSMVPSSGCLAPGETQAIRVTLLPRALGSITASVMCKVENGPTLRLDVKADVMGPSVHFRDPILDFGLINFGIVGVHKEKTLTLTNSSSVPAEFVLHQAYHRAPDFSSSSRPSTSVDDREDERPLLTFSPSRAIIAPASVCEVIVLCTPRGPTRLRTYVECRVRNGPTECIAARADVQAPLLTVRPRMINHAVCYVGVSHTFRFTMQNLTNLPARYCWNSVEEPSHVTKFSPAAGIIPGKASVEVTGHFIGLQGGPVEAYYTCDVDGLELPLACKFSTEVKPLQVSFHRLDSPEAEAQLASGSMDYTFDHLYPLHDRLPSLDFGRDVPISSTRSLVIIMRNHTAIPAPYAMSFGRYAAHEPEALTEMEQSTQNRRLQSRSFSRISTASSIKKQGRGITVKLEDRGEQPKAMTVPQLHAHLLKNNKGAAFVCQPSSGVLRPFEVAQVTVHAFNDMPGDFEDELTCLFDGGLKFSLPLCLKVRGSSVFFFRGNLGMRFLDTSRDGDGVPQVVLRWPVISTRSPLQQVYTRQVIVVNSSPQDVLLQWNFHDLSVVDLTHLVALSLDVDASGEVNVSVGPAAMQRVTGPCVFRVEPEQMVVPARGQSAMVVSFDARSAEYVDKSEFFDFFMQASARVRAPMGLSKDTQFNKSAKLTTASERERTLNSIDSFEVRLQAGQTGTIASRPAGSLQTSANSSLSTISPALSDAKRPWQEAPQSLSLFPLRLYLQARTERPHVEFDATKRGGVPTIKFRVHPYTRGQPPKDRPEVLHKCVTLTNRFPSDLHFSMALEDTRHFSMECLPDASSGSVPISHEGVYTLSTNQNLVFRVSCRPPAAAATGEWPLEAKHVLQTRLLLAYDNGAMQMAMLLANLHRPHVMLDSSLLDFGTGQVIQPVSPSKLVQQLEPPCRTVVFHVRNCSLATARWRVVHEAPPSARGGSLLSNVTLRSLNSATFDTWKVENAVDHPDVFQFSAVQGELQPNHLPEEGRVEVSFRPTQALKFLSRFRVVVEHGTHACQVGLPLELRAQSTTLEHF